MDYVVYLGPRKYRYRRYNRLLTKERRRFVVVVIKTHLDLDLSDLKGNVAGLTIFLPDDIKNF